MKTKILSVVPAILLMLSFSACNKNDGPVPFSGDIDLALEEVFADDLFEDVMAESYDVLFDFSDYMDIKSDPEDADQCRTKTVERPEGTKFPKIVTLDWGEGCEDKKGNIREGKIIITINGRFREQGSTRVTTFENYAVNGNQIEGIKTLTNTGRNEDGNLEFTHVLENGKITRVDGLVIDRSFSKTREWVYGDDTRVKLDDVFLINGTVSKSKNEVGLTKTISNLVRRKSCRFPVSGVVEITATDGRPLVAIDYGDGTCDKFATATVGEGEEAEVYTINLSKRGKKWKKQNGDDGVEKESGEGSAQGNAG